MKLSNISKTAAMLTILTVSAIPALATPWKFGVISDTQWIATDDGYSPASTPAWMIKQIHREFINQGVKVVISVGDTVDTSTAETLETRALYCQDLYNAGIGFYPLRGNHESGLAASGANFAYLFPQIVNGGTNNMTPIAVNPNSIELSWTSSKDLGLTTYSNFVNELNTVIQPTAPAGSPFVVGGNFSYAPTNMPAYSGTAAGVSGNGLSYSFDYQGARFIMIDQFMDSSLGGNTSSAASQIPWINGLVSDVNRPVQAFVFSHKQLLGGQHKDNLFNAQITSGASGDPGDGYGTNYTGANLTTLQTKQAAEDSLISSLYDNNVRYIIGGHDHHHSHSIVKSPLHTSKFVEQLIAQSDSSKFYTPQVPYSGNQVMISEDLWEVGYYIFTVDGPRTTVDYYAVPANMGGGYAINSSTENLFSKTPVLTGNWSKKLTFGSSLNGQEFQVDQGASYTGIADDTTYAAANSAKLGETGFVGTSLAILSGTNASVLKTHDGRALHHVLHTGWTPANGTVSDICTLWGLVDFASAQSDTITVSLSYPEGTDPATIILGARDPKSGAWMNAVDANLVGGVKSLKTASNGAFNASYGLGSYGVDTVNHKVWAVVNGNASDFAVITTTSATLPWDFDGDGKVTTLDLARLMTAIQTHSTDPKYDLNGDGKVDVSDTRWLTQHYTKVGGAQ